ncbi:MAG: T9SS type A sorting domain-containing protein [Bacteroidia bacterium]
MFTKSKQRKIFTVLVWMLSPLYFCGQNWGNVGGGTNNSPVYFGEYNNKLIVTGGDMFGTKAINVVASWNGSQWDSLGAGPSFGGPFAYSVFDNQLYAGGQFNSMAGVPNTYNIARWNGSQWLSASSSNNVVGTIKSLITYNNELYAAGNITTMDGVSVNRIAKWNGSNWSNVSGGVTGGFGYINCMAVYKGQLYVGGDFGYAGGKQTNYIARWNGTVWDSVGMGLDYFVTSMVVDSVADVLYVSGAFGHAGSMNTVAMGVAKWDGTTWSAVGGDTLGGIRTLEIYHNELYAAGTFVTQALNGEYLKNICRWNGSQWHSVGGGTNESISALKVCKDTLYVGGDFTQAGNTPVNYIAKWFSPNTSVEEKKNEIEYLDNNIPNPSNNSTQIPYFLPIGSKAVLEIHNSKGELIKTYSLTEGSNKLQISLAEYSNGIYFYTLTIDEGRIIRHKKMVLNK